MKNVRIIAILLVFILQAHLLRANDCVSLPKAEQLIEQNQYEAAINHLQSMSCKSNAYYNLLLKALIAKESYAQVRQYSSSLIQLHSSDSKIKTTAYFWDAIALYHLKQYSEAEQQIIKAESECSDKKSTTYATICNTHGNILESLKLHDNALKYYSTALNIYQTTHSPSKYKWIMGSLNNIANIYIQQNSKKAEEYLKQAMKTYKEHPENTFSEYLLLLNNIGQYYLNKKDYNNASIYYKKAVEIEKSHIGTTHSSYGGSLLNLITTLYNNEQYNETNPYIEEYLEFLRYTLQRNFTVMSESEREKYWNSQSQILDNLLVTATYAALSNKQDASTLYNICLLSKSLLLDTSIKMEELLENTTNKSIKNTYKELKATEQELIKIENKDVSKTKHLSEKSDSLRQCLFKQLEALQSQMSQLHITWQDIQKNLTKNDLAVEFICLGSGKDTEYAVILLRSNWKTPRVYYLNALAETLEAKQISRLQMHDNSIFGKLVWQHIIDEAKPEDRIYFVPAGELQLMAAEHFTIRENYRMNERYEMHRLSSTKQLLLPQNKSPHHEVALIGGMDYNASIEEISYYADQYGYNNQPEIQKTNNAPTKIWLPLPGALKEVQTIDSLITNAGHNSFLATHDAATDAALFSLTGKKYDIIHIATHGFYADTKDDEMQKSGLVMAGANTLSLRPNSNLGDGILTIKELSNLNLKTTQLAVLSACQTGVGDITTEGVFGLQRAFKIAGVRSLIVSLWEVNDAVTAKLMTSFYKALLLNYDYYTAFSIAIENVRKTKFNIQGTSISGDNIELFGAFVLVD